ncbi:hypothetical protein [Streptomyces sp. MS2.AVA.5]|uniref:Uncharacterized protein n=1 Tax=Streptomyces achmelvichensis TaxID=3134111 RepID=A0ACC6PM59_9ACTN
MPTPNLPADFLPGEPDTALRQHYWEGVWTQAINAADFWMGVEADPGTPAGNDPALVPTTRPGRIGWGFNTATNTETPRGWAEIWAPPGTTHTGDRIFIGGVYNDGAAGPARNELHNQESMITGGSISGYVATRSAPNAQWLEFDMTEFSGHPGGHFNPNPNPRGKYRLVINAQSNNVYLTYDHYGQEPQLGAPPGSPHFHYLGRF